MKHFDTQELCGRLNKSRGYNMNTCSGRPVWPADPRAEDIRIEDIAGSLSRLCRFNGHIKDGDYRDIDYGENYIPRFNREWVNFETYSVAQHSVLVEEKVAKDSGALLTRNVERMRELRLAALLHDAHEYVLGDMIKPQKKMYESRKKYEMAWDDRIAERFGFDPQLFEHPAIKEADYRIFLTEKRDVIVADKTDFGTAKAEPYPEQITPVLPSVAREMFLTRFRQLYRGK